MSSNKIFKDLLEEIDQAIQQENNQKNHSVNSINNNNSGNNYGEKITSDNINNTDDILQSNNIKRINLGNNNFPQDEKITKLSHNNNEFYNSNTNNLNRENIQEKIENMTTQAAYSEENMVLKGIMNKVIMQWLNNEGKIIVEEFFKTHIMRVMDNSNILQNMLPKEFFNTLPSKIVSKYMENTNNQKHIKQSLDTFVENEIHSILKPIVEVKVDNIITKFGKFIHEQ